jgi:hypothetical protein
MVILVVGAGVLAVAGLSGVLVAGRRARRREQAAAAEAAMHPHYCAECDEEWPHAGQTCLYPWAQACPKCAGAPATADVAPVASPTQESVGLRSPVLDDASAVPSSS